MLERYGSGKYILQPPVFDSFQPDNAFHTKRYAQRRPITSFYRGAPTLPINVAPALLHKKRSGRYGRIANDLGLALDLQFTVASFPFKDPENSLEKHAPVHLFTSFTHNNMNVAGPWCPSLGHPVMMQEDIPFAMKESFVKESIFHLQDNFDAVILGIPTRKDGSATDALFMDDNLGGVAFSHPDFKDITYYFYPGCSQKDTDALLGDKDFYRIINAIESTRRKNINEYKELAAKLPTRQRDNTEVADYLQFLFQSTVSQR